MSTGQELIVRLREHREKRGWSQQELADRSGLSRAGISAIEMGRVAPSTAAALSLATALELGVEDLFHLGNRPTQAHAAWAWPPKQDPARFWLAAVGGQVLRFPVEYGLMGVTPHDGVYRNGRVRRSRPVDPQRTLVIAGCDPAAGILISEAARQEQIRVIVLPRSSSEALMLLAERCVHAAGIHLNSSDAHDGNATAVRSRLGPDYQLVRVTHWEAGIALHPQHSYRSPRAVVGARLRWIGRDEGSGARQCQDELLGGRTVRNLARDHRGVSDAVRHGYADAGVCVRLNSEEAGLRFLPIRSEPYDLVIAKDTLMDWRVAAMLRVVRSSAFRTLLRDLPGYDPKGAGDVRSTS